MREQGCKAHSASPTLIWALPLPAPRAFVSKEALRERGFGSVFFGFAFLSGRFWVLSLFVFRPCPTLHIQSNPPPPPPLPPQLV